MHRKFPGGVPPLSISFSKRIMLRKIFLSQNYMGTGSFLAECLRSQFRFQNESCCERYFFPKTIWAQKACQRCCIKNDLPFLLGTKAASQLVRSQSFAVAHQPADIFFRLGTRYHKLMSAAETAQTEIHPYPQHKKAFILSAGMRLFHFQYIIYPDIHKCTPII